MMQGAIPRLVGYAIICFANSCALHMKRVMGIEPTYPAWKAGVLPLNYTRIIDRVYSILDYRDIRHM